MVTTSRKICLQKPVFIGFEAISHRCSYQICQGIQDKSKNCVSDSKKGVVYHSLFYDILRLIFEVVSWFLLRACIHQAVVQTMEDNRPAIPDNYRNPHLEALPIDSSDN